LFPVADVVELEQCNYLLGELRSLAKEIFSPPPNITVSEWADQNRRLSRATSSEPGQWRTARVPYLREVMDTLGDFTTEEVVFAKGTRVGGSECGNNFLGRIIHHDPCGVLICYPTLEGVRTWSKEYLDPMLRESKVLRQRMRSNDKGRRERDNTITRKSFANGAGYLGILSAGSTSQLRARAARVVIEEEIDEWDEDVGEQGDPSFLLEQRNATFWNKKTYKVSTPTIEGFSRIWREYESSDMRKYLVCCPDCGHEQELVWQDDKGTYRIIWDRAEDGSHLPDTAKYQCRACEYLIGEEFKMGMLTKGRWAALHPERGAKKAGFHISQLYSPFVTWASIAKKFLKAQHSPSLLKAFVNTCLGLPFEETGERIDQHYLSKRVERYGKDGVDVPHGVALLTAGVDVQGGRLECVVWGWGKELRSWAIDWKQFHGDTGQLEVWVQLLEYLRKEWAHANGSKMRVVMTAIDAGHNAEAVRRFVDSGKVPCFSTLGRAGAGLPILQTPEEIRSKNTPSKWKRKQVDGPKHHIIGTDSVKDELLSRLRVKGKEVQPGEYDTDTPMFTHFTHKLDPVFFEQLTSEKKKPKYTAGVAKWVWEKLSGRNNEVLDCTVYARAALQKGGMDIINHLGEIAAKVSARNADPTKPSPTTAASVAVAQKQPKLPQQQRQQVMAQGRVISKGIRIR
jgi:phage terminase large subunit GpA-like protein